MRNRYGQGAHGKGAPFFLLAALAVGTGSYQGTVCAAQLSEQDFLSEVPIVLSVSRLMQPASEAPGAITVIDREMIRASGAREIPDLFRLVPGFQVGHPDGHTATVTYHGLADQFSRRMQVLVDGRSIYTPLFGGVDWSTLPLVMEDIERIEVIRGPNAASYGANSFLGAINIITRHAAEDRGSYISATRGTDGVVQGTARYAGVSGDLSYRLTVGHRADDGFQNVHDSQRINLFSFRGDYRLTPSDALMIQGGATGGTFDAGVEGNIVDRPRSQQITDHFQQVRWQRVFDADHEFGVQYYHNYHRTDDAYAAASPLPFPLNGIVNVDYGAKVERHDVEFQHILRLSEAWRVVWGAGARRDEVTAAGYSSRADTFSSHLYRLFGNAEWRISRQWLLNAGAMVEKSSLIGTDISPRMAINYHIAPNHSLRFGVSRAIRTPVLLEEKADLKYAVNGFNLKQAFLAQGGLAPESILSREVGYIGEFPRWNLVVDVRAYRDSVADLIGTYRYTLPPGMALDPETLGFRNQDNATLTGYESQFRFKPSGETQFSLAHAYTRIAGTSATVEDSAPLHTIGALLMHRFPGEIFASLGYYQVGAMEWMGDGDALGSFRRWDVRLAHRFKSGGARGEVAVVTQNLFNNVYRDFRQGNLFDTRSYLSLSLEF